MIISPLRSFVISGRVDQIGCVKYDDQHRFSSASISVRVNTGKDKQSKFHLTIQDKNLYLICQEMAGKYVYAECEVIGTNYFKLQEIGLEPIFVTQDIVDKMVFRRAFDSDCQDDFLYRTCLEALKDKLEIELSKLDEQKQLINFTFQKKQKKVK